MVLSPSHISADEEVTGGSAKVSLMYGFLPIYKHTFDLCELLQYVKKDCPVPKGILDITMDAKIPMDVPGVSWQLAERSRLYKRY